MMRLLIYAAMALAVFSCTYGGNSANTTDDSITNRADGSNTATAADTATDAGAGAATGINKNAGTAGSNNASSGVTGTTNNRDASGKEAAGRRDTLRQR